MTACTTSTKPPRFLTMTLHLVTLCTGNAARSVMAGALFAARLDDVTVSTSGTHVIEGMPMSWRTRRAIEALGLSAPAHRSRQLTAEELDTADLVVAMARDHVMWMRRTHPVAAPRTATLRRLVRDLADDGRSLGTRLDDLSLAEVQLEDWEDISDPAGGDEEVFAATAREIAALIDELMPRLRL